MVDIYLWLGDRLRDRQGVSRWTLNRVIERGVHPLGHVYGRRHLMFAGRGRQWAIVVAVAATAAAIAVGTSAMANANSSSRNTYHEQLSGFNETLVALSTSGEGQFELKIDRDAQEMSYVL